MADMTNSTSKAPLEKAVDALRISIAETCLETGATCKNTSDGLWTNATIDPERVVRAVIAAIREPSNDIFQAGFDAEATANPHKTQPHHVVPAVWEAMIDALLAASE